MKLSRKTRTVVLMAAFVIAGFVAVYQVHSQEQVQGGYVVISAGEGGVPAAAALFSFRNGRTLVSEAAVEAVAPISRGRIFVDQAGAETGIALVNATDEPADVRFTLRNEFGQLAAPQTSRLFDPRQQLTLFVDQLFDPFPTDFRRGSLTFETASSAQRQLAAVTIRQTRRQTRNGTEENLFATLPVVVLDDTAPAAGAAVLPQVGAGGRLSTQIILINRTDRRAAGQISLVDSAGAPLLLELQAERLVDSVFFYDLEPDGARLMTFTSDSAEPLAGYARVIPDEGSSTPAATAVFQIRDANQMLISEAGVRAVAATRRARLFVDSNRTRTGLALVNASHEQQEIAFELLDRNGFAIERIDEGARRETSVERQTIEGGGHMSIFADELFNLPNGFTGLLEIRSLQPVHPVSLKLTINDRMEQILTTLPVADLDRTPKAGPLIIPQIGFGQGFATRLILINGDAEDRVTGTLTFHRPDGQKLELSLAGDMLSEFDYRLEPGGARQLRPGNVATPSSVSLNLASLEGGEVAVNVNRSVQLRPVIVDSSGEVRDDFEIFYRSLQAEVASVDELGTVQGLTPGFSTLTITVGEAVLSITANVVATDSGLGGSPADDVGGDAAGRLYLASSDLHSILRAEQLTEAPEIYAGTSRRNGFQNGPRLGSLFDAPSFLAVSQRGPIFVSDSENHVIRRVGFGAADDEVSTLIGDGIPGFREEGGSFRFNDPRGVAFDSRGQLWVADSGNHVIRRINLNDRTAVTIAGIPGQPGNEDGMGSEARFNAPAGLAVVPEPMARQVERGLTGELPPPEMVVVADSGNGILRLVREDGLVETVGTLDASQQRLRVTAGARPATLIRFDSPTGVAVDAFGNFYVSEPDSDRVRVVLSDGRVTSIAQPGTFSGPRGLTVMASGEVVVADGDRSARRIRFGAPKIEAVSPEELPSEGGRVIVVGRNFAPETSVVLAGQVIDANDVEVIDTRRIRFNAPAGLPSGRSNLTVQNRGGISQTDFLVRPPLLEQLAEGEITTVAGGSTFTGDGLPAELAALRAPSGIAVDVDGSIFVSDTGQQRVRRIDGMSGIITTVAGTGLLPENLEEGLGDGGPAVAASLAFPRGLALDGAGNLYIADEAAHRIRRVDAETGIITTVAGGGTELGDDGPAVEAQLSFPRDVLFDAQGNLLIADTINDRVRWIDEQGVIRTLAGSSRGFGGDGGPAVEARLARPSGLALDQAGNIYVADTRNNRIRRIDPDGVITTVVGPGSVVASGGGFSRGVQSPLSNPRGVAVDEDGNLLIADSDGHRALKFTASSGVLSVVAGTGEEDLSGDGGPAREAALDFPNGIAVDGAGNLLIADTGNSRLRRVSPFRDRLISNLAGGGRDDFLGDGEAAVAATLRAPTDVELDAVGNLFVADAADHRIRKVSAFSRLIETVAGTGRAGSGPDGAAIESDLRFPGSLAADSQGNLFVADTSNHRVRRVDLDSGVVTTLPLEGELLFPRGLAVDDRGNLVIGDSDNHRILGFDRGRESLSRIAGVTGERGFDPEPSPAVQARFYVPTAIAVDGFGNVFVADSFNHVVRRIDAATGMVSTAAGTGEEGFEGDGGPAVRARLNVPRGVAVDDRGNLFIADSFNQRIRRVDAENGIITSIAGQERFGFSGDGGPAAEALLNFPYAVALDDEGNLFIADRNNHRVRVVRGGPALGEATSPISLTINANPSPVNAGQRLTYTVTVINNSGSAEDLAATVVLPRQARLVSQPDDCIPNAARTELACSRGGVGPGDSVSFVISVAVDENAGGSILTARAGCSGDIPCRANVDTPVRPDDSADLQVVKTGPSTIVFPDPIDFNIKVTNFGPLPATRVMLIDEYPSGFAEFVSARTDLGSCTASQGRVECELGVLAVDSQANVVIVLAPTPAIEDGDFRNTARVEAREKDSLRNDNADFSTARVLRGRGLFLEKSAPEEINPGAQFDYRLEVSSRGEDAADVVISDMLPQGVEFLSAPGCQVNGRVVECAVGALREDSPPAAFHVRVRAEDSAANPLINEASCASPNADSQFCMDEAVTTVRRADCAALSLEIEAPSEVVYSPAGSEPIEYLLTVTNLGPATARNLTLVDQLPVDPLTGLPGVDLKTVEILRPEGDCTEDTNGEVRCKFEGGLAPEAAAQVRIEAEPFPDIAGRPVDNTLIAFADNSCPGESSSTGADQRSVVSLGARTLIQFGDAGFLTGVSDVQLVKTASSDSVALGGTLTYEIQVSNVGPTTASNVVITDTLPPGTQLLSAPQISPAFSQVCSRGVCTNVPDVCGFSRLPNGQTQVVCEKRVLGNGRNPEAVPGTATVTIEVAVDESAGPRPVNCAEAVSDEEDPDRDSASDCATVRVEPRRPQADLVLEKRGPATARVGEQITYTLTVRNAGPGRATGVEIRDVLPVGLSFVSVDGCVESSPGPVNCSVGNLGSGQENDPDPAVATVTLTVEVGQMAESPLLNTASCSSSQRDPNGCFATAVTRIGPPPNLTLTMAADRAEAMPDDEIKYTLTVHNAGPGSASGVRIDDPLPCGLTFVSSSQECELAEGSVQCSLGALGVSTSRTATIVAKVLPEAAGTPILNTASCRSDESPSSLCSAEASTAIGGVGPPPRAVCKQDVVEVQAGSSCMAMASIDDGSLSEPRCGGFTPSLSLTQDPPGPYDFGDTPVTLTVTNQEGASDSCNGLVRVVDTMAPMLPPLPQIEVGCSEEVEAPTATDNCGGQIQGTTDDPLTYSQPGTFTILWSFEDGNGNVSTQTQTVIVRDCPDSADPPNLELAFTNCPSNATYDPESPNQINYTIQVDNTGDDPARDVMLLYTLPVDPKRREDVAVEFLRSDSDCTEAPNGKTVSCSLGTIENGRPDSVSLVLEPLPSVQGRPLESNAQATFRISDALSAPAISDSCRTVIMPDPENRLTLKKTADRDAALPGEKITYTLTVRNEGPTTATEVTIDDPLPAGVAFDSSGSSAECSPTGGSIRCDLGTLGRLETSDPVAIVVSVLPEAAGWSIANTATCDSAERSSESAESHPECTDEATTMIGGNQPPQAICKDVVMSAGPACQASAAIDDGSFDPEGLPVTLTQNPPGPYPLGETAVVLTATDHAGATASCTGLVRVVDEEAPTPDVPVLPDAAGECSVQVQAPTATDNCAGTITATTDDPLSYSQPGSHSILWTFDDGHGNMATQAQTVTVSDSAPPVPDMSALATIAGECFAEITAVPTASDACVGVVQGTTGDPLSYSEQGTFSVLWTFDDGNGNVSSQTQTVVVDDTAAPVPDLPSLLAVTGQCSAEITAAPTATDGCGGIVQGTTSDPLSYSEQGTFSVLWTFEDGNGNVSTQTQNVVVDDTAAPVPDSPSLPTVTGQCSAEVATTPTATDNCAGSVLATTSDPLSYTQQGTFTVLWAFEDGNGNASSQTQTVTVTDTIPPAIEMLTAVPGSIWPPDHEMVAVTVSPVVSDNCGAALSCRIVAVTSNEPVTGAGDVTSPDWEITGNLTVNLRSERTGGGVGRVYTIHVECSDGAGNASTSVVQVPVTHDQS